MKTLRINFLTVVCLCSLCLIIMLLMSNYGPACSYEKSSDLTAKDKLLLYHNNFDEFKQEIDKYKLDIKDKIRTKMRTSSESVSIPWIYAITPTYARPQQKADLTRLSQTLLHLPNFHWIVIEDSSYKSDLVTNFLHRSRLNYTHLFAQTPLQQQLKPDDPHWSKFRGVLQRNVGLQWLRKYELTLSKPSVLYFMDDDNTYDLQIFKEMRKTQRVSVWPVGLVSKLRYEKPICSQGKVTGWFTYWQPQRPFVTDMAGFAINTRLIFRFIQAEFSYTSKVGYLESDFLGLITSLHELEPLLNCTTVLVWHTRTETPDLTDEAKMIRRYGHGSDINIEI